MTLFTTIFQLGCCLVVGAYSLWSTIDIKKTRKKLLDGFQELVEEYTKKLYENAAYWIFHDDEILGLTCECSNCHAETCGDTPFCPHCGKRMKKGETIHEVEGEAQ